MLRIIHPSGRERSPRGSVLTRRLGREFIRSGADLLLSADKNGLWRGPADESCSAVFPASTSRRQASTTSRKSRGRADRRDTRLITVTPRTIPVRLPL